LSKSASRARLVEIIRKRSFGRGEITLASGRKSNFYFNLKPTMLDPEGAALLAELTYEALKDDGLDYIGGLEMGAVPLAGAVAQLSWLKGHPIAAFFVRKKPKEHGARLAVEGLTKGESLQGKRVVIVEDVTTTGESALKAVEAVRDAGGEVVLVLTMVDREEGATDVDPKARQHDAIVDPRAHDRAEPRALEPEMQQRRDRESEQDGYAGMEEAPRHARQTPQQLDALVEHL